jgi:hypothetical protein
VVAHPCMWWRRRWIVVVRLPRCSTRDGNKLKQLKMTRREVVTRTRGDRAASSDQDVGGGSLRRSPGSENRSQGFAVRSSSSSYAPIMVRSYESHAHRGITMLGFFLLRLKIGINPGLFIGFFGMDS